MSRKKDWTTDARGRANSSLLFCTLVDEVDRIIRTSGNDLVAGRASAVAGMIVAQLAHKFDFAPRAARRERVLAAMAAAWGDLSKVNRMADLLDGRDVDLGAPGSAIEKATSERDTRARACARALLEDEP